MFDNLLQPIRLGSTSIRNRIFNPPHGTTLSHQGLVSEDLIAYHQARAKGGAGLIILESITVHPSYGFKDAFMYAGSDDIIPGMQALGEACRQYDTPVFGQLFHAGRAVRLSHDGSRPVTYSASDVPDERYRVIPTPMPNEMVWEMIESYAKAAGRLAEAGLDGVEILSSMGYLIAQFLNPYTNRREDEFGGSFEKRLRFLKEILIHSRKAIGPDKTLGIRITVDEKTDHALDGDDVIKMAEILDQENLVDYFSVISGSSATPHGWIHVFPPMAVPQGFAAQDAGQLKKAVSKPVLVAGRINQPQTASNILASGNADMIGMVRALIADPEFVNKFSSGRSDEIRACVACNQACVGHRLAHHGISCIQNPMTGRERHFKEDQKAEKPKTVLVLGGGPAGMKAAVTAANRGHQVHLVEKRSRLGGQVNLAEKLPGRGEFGGVTTNLIQEVQDASIDVRLQTTADQRLIEEISPDSIIIATGANSRLPDAEVSDIDMIDGWEIFSGSPHIGQRVVVADWSCDWLGLGVAQKLAENGHHVRLMSNAISPGDSLQGIVKDQWIGELHRLGVQITPYARFFGADSGTAYFQHTTSNQPIVCEGVDTIVSCYAPKANQDYDWLGDLNIETHKIGDAVSPRTVEEAVLEGFKTAWNI